MTAQVERMDDPSHRGRSAYRVNGRTAAEVQDAISTIMATVDPEFGGVDGMANVMGPLRVDDGWGALIEVVFA